MPTSFRMGKYVGPSGISLAVVNIPPISPEDNISLVDNSYLWEENVSSIDVPVVKSGVDVNGLLSPTTTTNFVLTNITTTVSSDMQAAPLYYKHTCRFYHYSYGESPVKHVYITDSNGNILKGINYLVSAEKVGSMVYKLDIYTDFVSNPEFSYMVKYNRCYLDGSGKYPSWVETINALNIFNPGDPATNAFAYTVVGGGGNGIYYPVVPVVPKLGPVINSVGVSLENAPIVVKNSATNTARYNDNVTITFTVRATSNNTFVIQRDYNRSGVLVNDYLTSYTADSWGSATQFSVGNSITGICGVEVFVHSDNPLIPNDTATFTASESTYYIKSSGYEAIYMDKPKNVTSDDDWYLKVKAGSFRRRMDANGNPAPSGYGTLYEYSIPEYDRNPWSVALGQPYMYSINERPIVVDQTTIQLKNTPVFIDPSSVLWNPIDPGFPSSGSLFIKINDKDLPQSSIVDWEKNSGTVKLGQSVSVKDDILASYTYEEDFYTYPGFSASGTPYPDNPPFPYFELNLNPTPGRGYGLYASGSIASVFLRPRLNVDTQSILYSECLYHNFTGTPSGVYDFNLGTVSLGPNCKITDITVTDVRTRGGGLSKRGVKELDRVVSVQPEAQFFWDVGYFDGQAVPANGVIVVGIPKRVLTAFGGTLQESDVKSKVYKHMALGEYAIIQYI